MAIDRLREEIGASLGWGVRYTTIDGQGTLVEADASVDVERFQDLVRAAAAAARDAP